MSENELEPERVAVVENEIKHLVRNYDDLAVRIENVSLDLEAKMEAGFAAAGEAQATTQQALDRLLGYFQVGKGAWAMTALIFGAAIAAAGAQFWHAMTRTFR